MSWTIASVSAVCFAVSISWFLYAKNNGVALCDNGLPSGIVWYGVLNDGIAEAKATGKPIMLLSAAPQCAGVPGMWRPGKQNMDRSFLSDEDVIQASRKFVCIRLASYEDAGEAEFLKTVYVGRTGAGDGAANAQS